MDSMKTFSMSHYPLFTALPPLPSFGGGAGPIHFTAVSCTGFEESLFDCQHSVGVEPGCSHQDDAGVYCSEWGGGRV